MTNEEIKALLRELAEKAEAQGETRSKTVRITFDPKEKSEPSEEPKEQTPRKKEKRKARAEKQEEEAPRKKTAKPSGMITWQLPQDQQQPEEDPEDTDSFISVLPQKEERTQPKRPVKSREGRKETRSSGESAKEVPEGIPEDDQEAAPKKRPGPATVEPAEFESDADFFTGDFLGDDGEGKVWGLLAGVFGGIGSRVKDAAAKSREKARDAKEKRAAAKEQAEDAADELEETAKDDAGKENADAKRTGVTDSEGESAGEAAPDEESAGAAALDEESAGAAASDEDGAGVTGSDGKAAGAQDPDGKTAGTAASDGEIAGVKAPDEKAAGAQDPDGKTAGIAAPDGESADAAAPDGETAGEAAPDGESEGTAAPDAETADEEHSGGRTAGPKDSGENGEETSETDDLYQEEEDPGQNGQGLLQRLKDKGIAAKELIMIAAGAALLILIAVMAFRLMGSRTVGRAIEADEGLSVKVTREPGEWVKAGDVTLAVKAPGPIQSISVNGTPVEFEGTDRTQISYKAEDRELELMVVCEEEVLNARTKYEWIDSNAPELTIRDEGGRIVLEAADDLSGVAAVYYGEQRGFSNVPSYRPYTQPFVPEEGVVYSCTAQDSAGNMSVPVVTDFSTPDAIYFAPDQVHLFPGESAYVSVRTEPEYAYVSDLTLTNSDGAVIELEKNGRIRAITEGTAKIQASAPGLQPASCDIEVRQEAELTITTVGDITLGSDENFGTAGSFTEVYNANDSSYFFANVKSIFEADDITFGNLEGTLTNQGMREIKEYAFRGDPSYTQILLDGSIEAVTLANNHSRDYGDVSLADTQKYLDEAGIAWCYGDKIAYVDAEGVKVALIGIYVLADGMEREQQVLSTIREAKANGAGLVVVAFHWGSEGSAAPDETQQALAHLAVDNGADLVVGHHPHVLQGIELYKGKYIAYSLANFCFGGNTNPTDKDTMILQQTFTVTQDGTITPGEIRITPCSVSSESGRNNYQPTPATGTEQERIMNRIREMSQQLGTQLP